MPGTLRGLAVLWTLAAAATACESSDPGRDADVTGDESGSDGNDEVVDDGGTDETRADDAADDGDPAEDSPVDDAGAEDATGDADGATDTLGDGDGGSTCRVPADCQDGVFCNGDEACAPGTAGADARGCVAGVLPCSDACDEASGSCTPALCDADPGSTCASDADCDDGRACNGAETCSPDGSACLPGTAVACAPSMWCEEPDGLCHCPGGLSPDPCDDGVLCNGIERCAAGLCVPGGDPCGGRGCDETIDTCLCSTLADCSDGQYCNGVEGCNTVTFRCISLTIACPGTQTCMEGRDRCGYCATDADCSDGLACNGVEACVGGACAPPLPCPGPDADGDGVDGIAFGGTDCDDGDPTRYPGAVEVCDSDAHDEDCDPTTFGTRDADADGYIDHLCCNGSVCGDDCEDTVAYAHPTAGEVCNGVDDDCDGRIDEGVSVVSYRDRDGDGSGDPDCSQWACPGSAGWAIVGNDCDDTRSAIREGSTSCEPDGDGVRTCTAGAWVHAACSPGTSCRPQPDGTGLCL
jgi:hypothetical protein